MTLSTERPSWRSRLHRVLVRIAVGMFVLVCLTYVCAYAMEWHRRERLEALVQSIKTLQVGVTTDEEVRALSERYGGRFASEGTFTEPRTSTYSFGYSSPYLQGADGYHTLPGRRLWIAGAELVTSDRRLVRAIVRFMVLRSDGYVLMTGVDVAQRGPSYPAEWAGYEVFEPHYTGDPNEGLKVLLSPGGAISVLGMRGREGIRWMRIAGSRDSDLGLTSCHPEVAASATEGPLHFACSTGAAGGCIGPSSGKQRPPQGDKKVVETVEGWVASHTPLHKRRASGWSLTVASL